MGRVRKNTGVNLGRMTQDINIQEIYIYKWRKYIQQLVLNRIDWINLPDSVDERYLERVLAREGKAVFFNGGTDQDPVYMATKVVGQGPPDVYDNQTSFRAIGNNGFNQELNEDEGVLIWNSTTRLNDWPVLENFASDLASIDIVARVNRKQQKHGVLVVGKEGSFNDTQKVIESIERGDIVIQALESILENVKVEKLDMSVPYRQVEFHADRAALLDEMYTYLGILTVNKESVAQYKNYGELEVSNDPVARIREDLLFPRKQAAKVINERWGLDIQVDWRTEVFETMTTKDNENPAGEIE